MQPYDVQSSYHVVEEYTIYPQKKDHVHMYIILFIQDTTYMNSSNSGFVSQVLKLTALSYSFYKYICVCADANGTVRRFHELKREWGFSRLISLDTFKEASNGYLVDDSCIFGAEVLSLSPQVSGNPSP